MSFASKFSALGEALQHEVLAHALLLKQFSLVCGNTGGADRRRLCRRLLALADARLVARLTALDASKSRNPDMAKKLRQSSPFWPSRGAH